MCQHILLCRRLPLSSEKFLRKRRVSKKTYIHRFACLFYSVGIWKRFIDIIKLVKIMEIISDDIAAATFVFERVNQISQLSSSKDNFAKKSSIFELNWRIKWHMFNKDWMTQIESINPQSKQCCWHGTDFIYVQKYITWRCKWTMRLFILPKFVW